MSISLSISSSFPVLSHPTLKPNPKSIHSLWRPLSPPLIFLRSASALKPSLSPFPPSFSSRRVVGVPVGAARNGRGDPPGDFAADEATEARGQSTLPERFREHTKEVPERPVRWPWLIAVVFLVYAWRTVLWELSNWKKAGLAIIQFLGYLSKLVLALIFHYIGGPITTLIRCIEFCLNFAQSIYSSIVAAAPVPELTRIILLTSVVLAIAEVTIPDSVNSQSYLLTGAGLIGYGAVAGFIPEVLFWLLLSGMFCYSRFIKKRDGVSASLPSATVLVAVGEPWVRGLIMAAFLALAIKQHSESPTGNVKVETLLDGKRRPPPPVPLLLAALAIGSHLAAKWVRYRHLTWMIV